MKWTRETVIQEFQKFATENGDLSNKSLRLKRNDLLCQIRLKFGNYPRFLEVLGLDYEKVTGSKPKKTQGTPTKWTLEMALEEFRRFVDLYAPNVSAKNLRHHNNALFSWLGHHYPGGYRSLLEDNGFDYDLVHNRKTWTRDRVLAELKLRYSQGKSLMILDIQKEDSRLCAAMRRKFGDARSAIRAAGFDYEEFGWQQRWTKERVVEEFLSYYEDPDTRVSDILKNNNPLHNAIVRHFGSYAGICTFLGLDPSGISSYVKWTADDLLSVIKQMSDEEERLTLSNVSEKFPAAWKVASRYFGGFKQALEHLGLDYEDYVEDPRLASHLGIEFEKVVREMFKALGRILKWQYRGFPNIRPDFFDPQADEIIEVKLSSWSAFGTGTITEYLPYCKSMTIIYLRGEPRSHGYENLRMVDIRDYYDDLLSIGRKDIIDKFERLALKAENVRKEDAA